MLFAIAKKSSIFGVSVQATPVTRLSLLRVPVLHRIRHVALMSGQRCLHSLAVRSLWYFVSCKAHRVQKLTYLIFPRFLHLATQTLRQFVCTNLCESTFPDAVAA